jgi:2-hydroxy-3-keto-5-methylthiopentenyl-1-phosphate phosphatase
VSEAALDPVFQPAGAPVSVLIDFDGTISLQDVGDVLLTRLVEDQDEVRRMDQLYVDHLRGSRELIAWDMEVLPRDPAVLLREVDAVPLDETFHDLVRVVRESGAALEIVSDGVGFHVERMLARLGLAELPIATNATVVGLGGAGVTFPYGHPSCFVCGTCKRERVRRHQQAGRAVVFVGDGPSDRYAAHHADVIFAKWSLAAWCEVQGVAYEPWERLADVAEWMDQALFDGRLPADAEAYDAWAAEARSEVPTFICGPELWGDGRTVAVTEG